MAFIVSKFCNTKTVCQHPEPSSRNKSCVYVHPFGEVRTEWVEKLRDEYLMEVTWYITHFMTRTEAAEVPMKWLKSDVFGVRMSLGDGTTKEEELAFQAVMRRREGGRKCSPIKDSYDIGLLPVKRGAERFRHYDVSHIWFRSSIRDHPNEVIERVILEWPTPKTSGSYYDVWKWHLNSVLYCARNRGHVEGLLRPCGTLALRFIIALRPGPEVSRRKFGKSSLHHLWISRRETADVDVLCEGQTFKADKKVLMASSEVFSAMLGNELTKESQQGRIEIKDSSPNAVYNFLHFLYTKEVPRYFDWTDVEEVIEMMVIADKYDVQELFVLCQEELVAEICMGNVAQLAAAATTFSAAILRERVVSFLDDQDEDGLPFVQDAPVKELMAEARARSG